MKAVTLRAHFDGEYIRLDEPFKLEQDMPLAITVLSKEEEDERDSGWFALSAAGLEGAYGEAEPEYTPELVIEPNPDYEGG